MSTKYKNRLISFTIFSVIYIGFGIYSPLRMSMLNNILMSYVNVAMYAVSNAYIITALFLRNLI